MSDTHNGIFLADGNGNLKEYGNTGGGGSSSGGHTIVDASGTEMPAESKLQFGEGFYVSDDSTNGRTVVAPDTDVIATQSELSNLVLTGTTNTSGATIAAGTCFVLNGDFVTAKADIASGATFTLNTNYEKKSVGEVLKTQRIGDFLNMKAGFTVYENSAFISNNIIEIHGAISGLSPNTPTTVATVPDGYRPKVNVMLSCLGSEVTYDSAGYVATTGVIQVNSSKSSVDFCAMYIFR